MPRHEQDVVKMKGHVQCRRPTASQLADRRPLQLTDRDRQIMTAVYQQRLLPAHLIERAYFPEQRGARCSRSSCAYERIRQLWLWRYLERIELPVEMGGGSRPRLYAIGRKATPVVRACLGGDARVHAPQLSKLTVETTHEHDTHVGAFWAGLHETLRGGWLVDVLWRSDHQYRVYRQRFPREGSGKEVELRPDARFELVYADGRRQNVVLEMDMGSMSDKRFEDKLRVYEAAVARRLLGTTNVEVWIVAENEARLKELRRAVRHAVPQRRWGAYRFAPFGVLEPHRLADGPWTSVEGFPVRAFHAPPSADARAEEPVE